MVGTAVRLAWLDRSVLTVDVFRSALISACCRVHPVAFKALCGSDSSNSDYLGIADHLETIPIPLHYPCSVLRAYITRPTVLVQV